MLLFVFLIGVKGLGNGFKLLGSDVLDVFFSATTNPFMGLVIGILATTLVQSSSVSTSMIVGLVAAPESPLPVANAIPMIMGANIGTTVTNSLVSLGHLGRKDEFRRAFSVATCHDFFNFTSVAILLPFELATGFLRRSSSFLSSALGGFEGGGFDSPVRRLISAGFDPIEALAERLAGSGTGHGIAIIVISGVLIFTALYLLVRVMRTAMQTRVELYLSRFLGGAPAVAILIGIVATVIVQSSSITTSLLVPLAGAGLLTTRQAFPITVGANIGTTVTALLASFAVSGANAAAGVQIAIVHLLFNLSATLLIFPVERVRRLPVDAAEGLAAIAVRSPRWALAYVLSLFYAVPAALALLRHCFSS